MQRKIIAFRLREGTDMDIMAAVENVYSKKVMSAMCREGLRQMLNLTSDSEDQRLIEPFIDLKREELSPPATPTLIATVKSKPAIFFPQRGRNQ